MIKYNSTVLQQGGVHGGMHGGMYGGMYGGGLMGALGGMYGKGGMYGMGGMYGKGGMGSMYGMGDNQLEAIIEVKRPDTDMPMEMLLVFTDPAPMQAGMECPVGPVLMG